MKNKNSTSIFFSCLAAFLLGNAVQAQEWQIEGAAHLIQPHGDGKFALSDPAEGFSAGMGYSHYLNSNWSIGTGVSYLRTELNFSAPVLKGTSMETDMEGDPFEFRYKTGYFEESVRWQSLRIPLIVQYETSGIVRWYLRTGVLYGLQLGNSTYRQQWNDLQTSGYYAQWDAELHGPAYVGFGKMGSPRNEGSVKLRNTFSWIAETGVKQRLRSNDNMYIGLFVELGLNDMRPERDASGKAVLYTQDMREPLRFNSVLNQAQYKDRTLETLKVGFKIRYSFQFSN